MAGEEVEVEGGGGGKRVVYTDESDNGRSFINYSKATKQTAVILPSEVRRIIS